MAGGATGLVVVLVVVLVLVELVVGSVALLVGVTRRIGSTSIGEVEKVPATTVTSRNPTSIAVANTAIVASARVALRAFSRGSAVGWVIARDHARRSRVSGESQMSVFS